MSKPAMRKPALTTAIAKKTGLSKPRANEVLNAITDEITEAVAENDSVSITGLGKFFQRERKARSGVNPRTGVTVEIPASRVISFSAAKALKDAVNHR